MGGCKQRTFCPTLQRMACQSMVLTLSPGCPRHVPLPARFELHVYTMGDRDYAAEMAKLLDPEGRLFHGRVISAVSSLEGMHVAPGCLGSSSLRKHWHVCWLMMPHH